MHIKHPALRFFGRLRLWFILSPFELLTTYYANDNALGVSCAHRDSAIQQPKSATNNFAKPRVLGITLMPLLCGNLAYDAPYNRAADKRRAFRGRAASTAAKAQSFHPLVIRQSKRSERRREQADAGAQRRIRRPVHPGRAASRMNQLSIHYTELGQNVVRFEE